MKDGNMRKMSKEEKAAAMRQDLLNRKDEAAIVRKIVARISVAVLLLFAITAIGGYIYVKSALKPLDNKSDEEIRVEIPVGSSTNSIGRLLEEKGVIKNASVFKYYVKLNNISGFQAGTYTFSPSMTLKEISGNMQSGILAAKPLYKITIPEGYSLDQIAGLIAEKTGTTKKSVMERLDSDEVIKEFQNKYPDLLTNDVFAKHIKHPLEGYLYPATYSFYEQDLQPETIVDPMIEKTAQVLGRFHGEIAEKKKSVHELLTMASIVEKEATEKADRHMISSVFNNRLKENMPLQTDPTVLYALGKHKDHTLYKDLKVDSPYNTYKVKGLPPGPIASAGESSIEAALHPADTQYLYFLAEYGSGKVHYSESLKEHNELKAKYITDKRNE